MPVILGFIILAALFSGCARSEKAELYPGFLGPVSTPQPPLFLVGPMAVLLTNFDGFTARAMLTPGIAGGAEETVSGQLLGRGSRLVFAPDGKKSGRKHPLTDGITFLWDVAQNSGCVLSEP